MRRLGQVLAVLTVLVVSAGLIHAAGTPGQKCAASKIKAAGKKVGAKLKCISKAVSKGEAVDGACLSKADDKFNKAVGKAESKGGCALTGDGPTLEAIVDLDANAVAAFADPNVPVCCSDGGGRCIYTTDETTCSNGGGIVGTAGTVCDGATGLCVAPPASPGGCCSGPAVIPGFKQCIRPLNETDCESSYSGAFDPNSICPPNGGPCVPFF